MSGRTHWETCWDDPRHLECAFAQCNVIHAEALTDGGWQVQVVPFDSCEPGDWVEGPTLPDALRDAVRVFKDPL